MVSKVLNNVVNFAEKLKLFQDQWSPKIVAQMNDYHFKLARFEGEFTWHTHDDTDEVFIVIAGEFRIDFRESSVPVKEGELFVVPKGIEHRPFAEKECQVLLVEPAGTVNTGNSGGDQTAPNDTWV